MKAKAFCSLAVLILLLSTISYSQTTDAPKIKGKTCYELMKEQSECKKSNIVLSLSGGYAVLFRDTGYPNGFNIQADVMYPLSESFAFNLGVNFSQFLGYNYEFNHNFYDTFYVKGYDTIGKFTQINLMPGVSFGNLNSNSKFNYYITAGISLGLCRHAVSSTYITTNSPSYVIFPRSLEPDYYVDFGVFASGRISYKVSDRFRIFLEPTAFSDWKESYESNLRINGGVSLNL
ncbi:MAG: hypothetical protein NTY74_00860 [Ignavibacteriae bacterium]|nr:hypothetical protein [Ignavibacteriota bacterium]